MRLFLPLLYKGSQPPHGANHSFDQASSLRCVVGTPTCFGKQKCRFAAMRMSGSFYLYLRLKKVIFTDFSQMLLFISCFYNDSNRIAPLF